MTATEETPPLQADLADVLRLVAELATVTTMGRRGRQISLLLHNAGLDVGKFDGLVVEGEVYAARWHAEWAVCHCGDDRHEWRRDAPPGRSNWHFRRTDAETGLKRAKQQWSAWESKSKPEPHLVTHLVASTGTETVR
jgi:hypothetical protein